MKQGIYHHYKGHDYEVIGTALHTETEEMLVVYKSLDAWEGRYEAGDLFARPESMFAESVVIDGEEVPRFKLVSEA